MRITPVLAVLVALASPAFAQANHAQYRLFGLSTAAQNCPIDFQVRRQAGLVAHRAAEVKGTQDLQRLEFKFARLDNAVIASVDVTVHGDSSHGQLLPLQNDRPQAISETFRLTPRSNAPGVALADVWTKKITVVRWTEITAIRYANGTLWHASGDSQCRAPMPLLLLTNL